MKILIVYGTHFGQTAAIAKTIAGRLSALGHDVSLSNAKEARLGLSLEAMDAVIVGSSIELGKHRPEVVDFVRAHRGQLEAKVSAFFSVCNAEASTSVDGKKMAAGYRARFEVDTGWVAPLQATFAGALKYRDYNLILRWVMRAIASRAGTPTDTSKNHELTDWSAVDAFTDAFAQRLHPYDPPAALAVSQARTHAQEILS